ncbi:TRAP transporter large permease [Marinimicrococcus flavescens]|uniref:TRAP transporter large permease protein n=1 Tax=Marinimicrococcus flavescens TaxID=3031815 RepID=A0AAP3UXP9_9PROT|nr:TRAP transporter large permease [Marinimicrococcus flavescens]
MAAIALCLLAVLALVLGFEMLMVMGLPSVLARFFYYPAMPDMVVAQKLLGGVNVSTLLAIPFFIFAAEIMAQGSIAARLMALVKRSIGHVTGGLGHTTVASCMAFGAVCGSAPATVAALGRLLHPEMVRAGYREKFSLGLIASSAECALLIPPSITLIVYGWLTGTSVAALFAGGLAVGVVLGLAFSAYVVFETRRSGAAAAPPSSRGERLEALRAGLLALGMPVLILGGIYSGTFTPTEAAAVSVLYALSIEMLVYRSMGLRKLVAVAESSAVTIAAVFILLAVGALLSYFITLARVPDMLGAFIAGQDIGWIGFLLIVNVVLLVAGMFIDPNSILLVMVPTLYPVALSLGIDPVHFGLVVCLNICIGMITPPFGLDLFVASSTLERPVETVIAGIWPFVAANIVVLAVISYVPAISLALPRLLSF